ncbi:zinc-containing alcohol dehydrogenase [Minicystis rosea]|nr:zinc-containing alcohol dehydrogenase [Minicystis rosea]
MNRSHEAWSSGSDGDPARRWHLGERRTRGRTSHQENTIMRAVGLHQYLPSHDERSLIDVELPTPEPGPHDLRVRVEAVSVNPVDVKVRAPKAKVEEQPRILGWDAAGVVDAVGAEVDGFRPGDRVYYAGSLRRSGANAELHLVDARLVAPMPRTLDFADAAALPLTGLTAWEGLFERLGLDPRGGDAGTSLLVIGAAGGVGSMVVQLAKAAGLWVIGTASRPETQAWVTSLGADAVIDHGRPLRPQLEALGLPYVPRIFHTQKLEPTWSTIADLVAPLGRIVGIVETSQPLDLDLLKSKSATFGWEFMFTRSTYATPDLGEQGAILQRIAAWIDEGRVRTTRRETLGPITAATLRTVHAKIESGSTIGKLVAAGWP